MRVVDAGLVVILATGCGSVVGQGSGQDTGTTDAESGGNATDASGAADSGDGDGDDTGGDGSGGDGDGDGGDGDGTPAKPPGLMDALFGNEADFPGAPQGPVILMAGGGDLEEAFTWWATRVAGGDVVVLRTAGADTYGDYLFTTIGGFDSVHTMWVDDITLANDPWVRQRVDEAEGLFIAGGWQGTYTDSWRGTSLEDGIHGVVNRGGALGGNSAGLAVLGEWVYAAQAGQSAQSIAVLTDPYDPTIVLVDDFLDLPMLAGVLTDTHFRQRDRMGRLVTFLARLQADGLAAGAMTGIGIDERTALLVEPGGEALVVGEGNVYLVGDAGVPQTCVSGMPLEYDALELRIAAAGDTVTFPGAVTTGIPSTTLAASGGALVPATPYAP